MCRKLGEISNYSCIKYDESLCTWLLRNLSSSECSAEVKEMSLVDKKQQFNERSVLEIMILEAEKFANVFHRILYRASK